MLQLPNLSSGRRFVRMYPSTGKSEHPGREIHARDCRIDSCHAIAVFERPAFHVYPPDRKVFVGARNNSVLTR